MEEQSSDPRYVGGGHGGPTLKLVAAARPGGADLNARSDDLGFDFLPGRRAASAEGDDLIIAVEGTYGQGLGKTGRRAHGAGLGAVVAGREDGQDAGPTQSGDVVSKGLVVADIATPGSIDDIRGESRIAGRGHEPLEALVQPTVERIALVVEDLDGDPARSGRDPDAASPQNDPRHVGAMPMPVSGILVAFVGRAVPIAAMVEEALGVVPAIPGQQGRVLDIHTGVHDSYCHALPVEAEGTPGEIGAHPRDVPLDIGRSGRRGLYSRRRLEKPLVISANLSHIITSGHSEQGHRVSGDGHPVEDPEWAVGFDLASRLPLRKEGTKAPLRPLGCLLQTDDDRLATGVHLRPGRGRREDRPLFHINDEAQIVRIRLEGSLEERGLNLVQDSRIVPGRVKQRRWLVLNESAGPIRRGASHPLSFVEEPALGLPKGP